MGFKRKNSLNFILLFSLSIALNLPCSFASADMLQFDTIRAEMSFLKDKNSAQYLKSQQKLYKIIKQQNIDYSNEARLDDIKRLMAQQKYNAAIFELNDLIDSDYKLSTCYELLGDISSKIGQPPKKIAQFYKSSVQFDSENISALYKLGCLYLSNNKNILAIENFKTVVALSDDYNLLNQIEELVTTKITPKSKYEANNLYEILGNIYIKKHEKQNSYSAYHKALKLNPDDIYLKYYLANLFYDDNQDENALELFNSILDENPYDYSIKFLRAQSFKNIGNLASAQKEYKEILADYPDSKQAKYGYYKTLEGKFSKEKILRKIFNYSDDYDIQENQFQNFAQFLEEMGDIEASNSFREYVICLKNEKLEKEQKERLALEQKKVKQKENNLEKQQKLNLKAQQERQAQLLKQNQTKEKIKKTDLVDKKQDKLKQDKIVQEQEQKNKALKQEQVELDKKIAQERAQAQKKDSKKYSESIAQINKYLSTNSKTTDTYFAVANTYKQINMPSAAIKYYKEAQKLNPINSDVYYNLGLTYFEMNNLQLAKNNLQKAINLDKENIKAKNLLAFVNQNIVTKIINNAYDKYEKKEYVNAYKTLDDGIKVYSNNSQLYYYRALVSSAMNRNAGAIIDLQKSIELDPSNYMSYYQLGQVYEKVKDERSALVAYERFLSIEPQEKDLIDEVQKKVINLGTKYY